MDYADLSYLLVVLVFLLISLAVIYYIIKLIKLLLSGINPYSKLNSSNKKYLLLLCIVGGIFGWVTVGNWLGQILLSPFVFLFIRLIFSVYYFHYNFSNKRFNNVTIIFTVFVILMILNESFFV